MKKQKALFRNETPTGNCFVVAFNHALEARGSSHELDVKVIHGSVYSDYFKKRIDHAWIEIGGVVVIDSTIKFTGRKDHYYSLAQAHVCSSYAVMEVMRKAVVYETYGPWPKEKKDETKSDKA